MPPDSPWGGGSLTIKQVQLPISKGKGLQIKDLLASVDQEEAGPDSESE